VVCTDGGRQSSMVLRRKRISYLGLISQNLNGIDNNVGQKLPAAVLDLECRESACQAMPGSSS
jgi:hypothetical protein